MSCTHEPKRPGKRSCAACAQRDGGLQRELRRKRVLTGICVQCGKKPAAVGRGGRCNEHADEHAVACSGKKGGPCVKRAPTGFPATREGECRRCRRPIFHGDLINKLGLGWAHATCPPKEKVERARKSAGQVRADEAARYWEEVYRKAGRRN